MLIIGVMHSYIGLRASSIKQITNNDGLSNSAILSILQDKDGYVWFGSCDGLNLYNGFDVTSFGPTNGDLNLSGNLIESMIESDDNVLWIHTNYGLNKLDKKKWHLSFYPEFKGLYFIEKDHHNIIYIINNDNCIFYYNKNKDSFNSVKVSGIKYQEIIDFVISSDDKLHIFTRSDGEKIYSISRKDDQISFIPIDDVKPKLSFLYCFHEANNRNIVYYIDQNNILFEYDLIKNQKYYIFDLTDNIKEKGKINSLIKFHDNYFIGYTTNGVIELRYTSDAVDKYKIVETEVKAGIFTLVKDRYQDLIWIGTDGNGVYAYSEDLYSIQSYTYDHLRLDISKPIRALYKDANNSLWIGTKGDGIVLLNKFDKNNLPTSNVNYFTSSNSDLIGNSIYAFEKSKHNILWIGTGDGLCYYSFADKRIKTLSIKTKDQSKIKFVHGILELNDSTLWIATVGDGIVKASIRWDGDTPSLTLEERIKIKDGRPESNYFFTIFNDPRNSKIWFGNRGYGAYYFQENSSELFNMNFDNLYANQTINDIYTINKDKFDNMWFGTSLGLIQQTSSNKLKLFSQKEGLPNNTVHSILIDDYNYLWLSTNKGIARFDLELNTFHNYNNGLEVIEFSDGAAFVDTKSKEIFFGGINGFVSINKENYTNEHYAPPIHYNDLVIFGNSVNFNNYLEKGSDSSVLNLSFNQNFFSLSFIALDYINGNDYDYYYKLEGLSNKWINNHSSHKISFTSIPPGKYTLQTKYINKLTREESPTYSLKIHISPPWYLTWWAYVLYGIITILILSSIIRFFYIRNKRKKASLMRKIEQQHTEDVYESKLNFFTNVANEFSTPLTLIYGPCSHILSNPNISQSLRQNALLIHKNAERMNNLIQDLIEFRKVEKGQLEPIIEHIEINNFIHNISDSFIDLSKSRSININYDLEKNIDWNSDKNFLYTIVINLISNAFQYTEDGGQIGIKVCVKSDVLNIIVTNTNNDVDINELNQVFDNYTVIDLFENSDNNSKYSKNDLGLATSYNMANALGGTIEIKSSEDKQISFVTILPKQNISKDLSNQISNIVKERKFLYDINESLQLPSYSFDQHKLSLMIIGENIEVLWFLCEMFKDEYNILPISAYDQVLDTFDKNLPNIIIYDVTTLDVNEISLIQCIKSNKKTGHIPFILISGKHSTKDQIDGMEAGAQVFISKPFDSEYLKVTVKNLLSGREVLKNYFDSPLSAFVLKEGQITHKEDSKFIFEIQEIINNNISNPDLSVQIIAEKLNISVRHLYRRIKEIEGDSLSDMIKKSRLHIARKYLINSQMTINEIIYKSGFSNRATFFRLFSQKYQCTPKEYREKNLNDGINKL